MRPMRVLINPNGAPGLIRAVRECLSHGLRQRCLARKTRTIADKVPESVHETVKASVQAAYYAPN